MRGHCLASSMWAGFWFPLLPRLRVLCSEQPAHLYGSCVAKSKDCVSMKWDTCKALAVVTVPSQRLYLLGTLRGVYFL